MAIFPSTARASYGHLVHIGLLYMVPILCLFIAGSWIFQLSKKVLMALDIYHFHRNSLYGEILTRKEPIRTHGFTSRLLCHVIMVHTEVLGSPTPSPFLPTHPSGNFSSGLYFRLKQTSLKAPSPLEFPVTFLGVIWIPQNPVFLNQKLLKRLYL